MTVWKRIKYLVQRPKHIQQTTPLCSFGQFAGSVQIHRDGADELELCSSLCGYVFGGRRLHGGDHGLLLHRVAPDGRGARRSPHLTIQEDLVRGGRKSLRLEAVHQIRSHRGSSTARARRRRPYEFARSRQIGRICRVVLLCVFGTLDKVFDALPDRRVTRVPFVPSTACKNPTRPPAGQSKTPVMIYRLFRFAPLALPCWLHRLGQQGAQHSRHQQGQHRGRQGQQHAHSFIQ